MCVVIPSRRKNSDTQLYFIACITTPALNLFQEPLAEGSDRLTLSLFFCFSVFSLRPSSSSKFFHFHFGVPWFPIHILDAEREFQGHGGACAALCRLPPATAALCAYPAPSTALVRDTRDDGTHLPPRRTCLPAQHHRSTALRPPHIDTRAPPTATTTTTTANARALRRRLLCGTRDAVRGGHRATLWPWAQLCTCTHHAPGHPQQRTGLAPRTPAPPPADLGRPRTPHPQKPRPRSLHELLSTWGHNNHH